ncbi:cytochrome p450, partial [Trifolium pratense]
MQGQYKCNVDAGFHDAEGKASVGWCVRDHMGRFILAGSSWIQGKCSTIEGEAIAMLEAMKELEQRGFTNVMFETDSKNVKSIKRQANMVAHTLARAAIS